MITLLDWNKWRFPGGDAWSDWHALEPATIEALAVKPGAYVVGLPESFGSLRRLLAADEHGLLDVGESGELRTRLRHLFRCATVKGQRGHMAGWRLGTGGLVDKLGITAQELRISWCYAEDGSDEEAYRLEGTILQSYFDLFGELPPLNYKFNWSGT
ncbi:MAG: hypothetical protein ABI548_11180 [Polyangiaceae bacterium]